MTIARLAKDDKEGLKIIMENAIVIKLIMIAIYNDDYNLNSIDDKRLIDVSMSISRQVSRTLHKNINRTIILIGDDGKEKRDKKGDILKIETVIKNYLTSINFFSKVSRLIII